MCPARHATSTPLQWGIAVEERDSDTLPMVTAHTPRAQIAAWTPTG
jgi:hypothetical protein